MKKIILIQLIALFIIKADKTNAQTYVPFPDSNAIWCAYRGYLVPDFGTDKYYSFDYQHYIFGDTVINALTYHRLFENGYFTCTIIPGGGSCGSYQYIYEYKGALREDGNKRIYFIAKDSLADMLLYDLNLNVYDTLPFSYNQTWFTSGQPLIVTSIDSIFDGTQYRKRFNISRDTSQSWEYEYVHIIEGIGSTHGLLWDINPYFEAGGELNACKQNGNIVYTTGQPDCEITSIEEFDKTNTIFFFPNPTTDFITIHYNLTSQKETTVSLFNLYGQKLKTILKEKQPAGEHEIKMDMRDFSEGIYFVKMNVGGKEEVRKVVKY